MVALDNSNTSPLPEDRQHLLPTYTDEKSINNDNTSSSSSDDEESITTTRLQKPSLRTRYNKLSNAKKIVVLLGLGYGGITLMGIVGHGVVGALGHHGHHHHHHHHHGKGEMDGYPFEGPGGESGGEGKGWLSWLTGGGGHKRKGGCHGGMREVEVYEEVSRESSLITSFENADTETLNVLRQQPTITQLTFTQPEAQMLSIDDSYLFYANSNPIEIDLATSIASPFDLEEREAITDIIINHSTKEGIVGSVKIRRSDNDNESNKTMIQINTAVTQSQTGFETDLEMDTESAMGMALPTVEIAQTSSFISLTFSNDEVTENILADNLETFYDVEITLPSSASSSENQIIPRLIINGQHLIFNIDASLSSSDFMIGNLDVQAKSMEVCVGKECEGVLKVGEGRVELMTGDVEGEYEVLGMLELRTIT